MGDNSCIRLYADPEQIKRCKNKLETARRSFRDLSDTLALAGNEARLNIIYLIEEERELCPCDLADILGMSIPAVSQHLKKLRDGGVVQNRKEGQTVYYSLAPEKLKILKPFIKHITAESQKLHAV